MVTINWNSHKLTTSLGNNNYNIVTPTQLMSDSIVAVDMCILQSQ